MGFTRRHGIVANVAATGYFFHGGVVVLQSRVFIISNLQPWHSLCNQSSKSASCATILERWNDEGVF